MQREMMLSMTLKKVEGSNMNTQPLARGLSRFHNSTALAIAGLSLSLAGAARADSVLDPPNLVQNGNFSMVSPNVSRGFGPITTPPSQQQPLAFWTVPTTTGAGSLQFVVTTAGAAGDSGMISNGLSGLNAANIGLWGPGVGVSNGFTAPSGAMCGNAPGVPCNYVALDADPGNSMIPGFTNQPVRGIITQSISGLTPGDEYELTFSWAGGQLWLAPTGTFSGSTTSGLAVSLGSQTQTVSDGGTCPPNTNMSLTTPTPGCGLPNHGFTGWMQENMIFTANATSEVLTFMGAGTPSGLPPVAMVTGVDLQPVPEPATWSLLGIGLAAIAGSRAYRRRKMAHIPDQARDA